jgi:glycerol uptake facilitator-like aquaporin
MNKKYDSLLAEFFGTALLLAVITGSGVMADNLSLGNAAVALLANSIATGCGLYVLITLLGPISGAHLNPMVSLMFWRAGALNTQSLMNYSIAQFTGAIAGVWATHLMFGLPLIQHSIKPRNGLGIWVSEFIATLILLSVIRLGLKFASDKVPMLVAMIVTAGYWFTSSTFFSNPAVTVARSLTNTFVGIQAGDVLLFISAELAATLLMLVMMKVESK